MVGGFVGDNSGLISIVDRHRQRQRRQFQPWPADLVGAGECPTAARIAMPGDGRSVRQPQHHRHFERERQRHRRVRTASRGGFAGAGSFIFNSVAVGNVTGGANSILGGFVGVHNIDGLIYLVQRDRRR